ncbi:MAG: tRNA1(Val) (adenine(37)-N6)-methyltransferase [Firmicutes bacterium]|nr:tRNA1(Val) (adenine(37)-N6)-methyltransferase [Bacillota bacterium]
MIDDMKNCFVEEGERIDDIGFGDLKLIQKPEEFCYGVDAVILADFAARHKKGPAKTIVDLGTGTGVIPLILSHKTDAETIVGVELQEASWKRACRNSEMNNLTERVSFINGDVSHVLEWGDNLKGLADVVVCNPPYFIRGGGLINDASAKTIARHETTAGLKEFLECAKYLLRNKGDLFMVHRPSRLADLCCYGRELGLEPKEMRFVSPNRDSAPNILLIHFIKGGGKELRFLDPLYVYEVDGGYTEELLKAYK